MITTFLETPNDSTTYVKGCGSVVILLDISVTYDISTVNRLFSYVASILSLLRPAH